jgi:hypothetical protein
MYLHLEPEVHFSLFSLNHTNVYLHMNRLCVHSHCNTQPPRWLRRAPDMYFFSFKNKKDNMYSDDWGYFLIIYFSLANLLPDREKALFFFLSLYFIKIYSYLQFSRIWEVTGSNNTKINEVMHFWTHKPRLKPKPSRAWAKGASPKLSVKTGPPAPLCKTAKSGSAFRVQECHT